MNIKSLIIYPNRVLFHFDQIRNIIFLEKGAVVIYTNRKDTGFL